MTDKKEQNESSPTEENGNRGFLGLIQSTLAAIFGIQSDKNREQDFKKGDASQFITMGILAAITIVVTMIIVVNSVLDSAAK